MSQATFGILGAGAEDGLENIVAMFDPALVRHL